MTLSIHYRERLFYCTLAKASFQFPTSQNLRPIDIRHVDKGPTGTKMLLLMLRKLQWLEAKITVQLHLTQ